MKRKTSAALALLMLLCLLCSFTGCAGQSQKTEFKEYPADENGYKSTPWPENVGDLAAYDWMCLEGDRDLSAYDFSQNEALLLSLVQSNHEIYPEASKMPKGFDAAGYIEWGKYAGLHMDVLYKHGLTGKGCNVAIMDQPFLTTHENFSDIEIEYFDTVQSANGSLSATNSMHGGGVTSLLAGKDIGTAPEAKIYYFEDASWLEDDQLKADVIQQIIDLNATLPEGEKISMISISDMFDRQGNKNPEAFHEAVQKANEAGIWVWLANYPLKLNDVTFLPLSDKDDPSNLVKAPYSNATDWTDVSWENVLSVPAGGRTTAYTLNFEDDEYVMWTDGGVSWSVPYLTGLAATAHSIAPDLTQEDMIELFLDTAFSANGLKIINPVGFMAKVLEHSGDTQLAQTILQEAGLS